jgi:AGZA family xanthine/uracil permease-like MFS transporter
MVYIVFVNPQILGKAGMDKGAVFRRDLHRVGGVDPGDGVLRQLPDRARARHGTQRVLRLSPWCSATNKSWQQALAAVFCSGVIFF